jgi:hypothetical protein
VVRWILADVAEERDIFVFYLEDGGGTFLRNVDKIIPYYMALYHRRL